MHLGGLWEAMGWTGSFILDNVVQRDHVHLVFVRLGPRVRA